MLDPGPQHRLLGLIKRSRCLPYPGRGSPAWPAPRSPSPGARPTLTAKGNVLHAVPLDRLLCLIKRGSMLFH